MSFTVEPKIYQRRWFWPGLTVLFVLLALAAYRLRIRRLRRRFHVVLAERNRIARELHDTLLQGLSGVTMQLQALWTKLPPSREKKRLAEIIADAGRCSAEARQSLYGLRSVTPESQDFSQRLAAAARQATAPHSHLLLSCNLEPVALGESPEVEYQLLRIAQEALANAVQHSQASRVQVSLRSERVRLLLTVEDDGIGFDDGGRETAGHFGVQGMRERAQDIDAELSIVSSPGRGTAVTVSLELAGRVRHNSNLAAATSHQLK